MKPPVSPGSLALLDEFGGQKLLYCRDEHSGLRAIIAVHSTFDGRAAGGTRMKPYVSGDAAARDAVRLARAMTLKYAAAGIPLGGAKAVIVGDPATDKDERLLRAFGRFVQRQGGEYWAAEDVGTTGDDMRIIGQETEWMVSLPADAGGQGDTSVTTAAGVLRAIEACCRWRWREPSVRGRHVTVQGLGQVGMKLARMLVDAGARVSVADVDGARVLTAVDELRVAAVAPEDILGLEADIFAPCALGDVINERNVDRVGAGVVAGAANNVFSSAAVADRFERQGRIYAVDFIANAGALVYDDQMIQRPRPTRFDETRAEAYAAGIFERTIRVFELAAEHRTPLWQAAESLALSNAPSMSHNGPPRRHAG